MAAVSANSIAGVLQVYAFKSIPAFAADLPPRDLWTENFDASVAVEGTAVITRVPTSNYGNLNDLSNGWENQQQSSSAITATLKTLGHDSLFNITEISTIGEAQILNTFSNILSKQVANGIFVNVANNVTSSTYTTTVTVNSASLFQLTGSTGLQGVGNKLDQLEIPQTGRYCILQPNAYQGLVGNGGVYQFLQYGGTELIRGNGFKDLNGNDVNSSFPGVNLAGFNVFKHPRINTTTALRPYGGDQYGSNDKLAGFAGNKAGLVVAARAPYSINAPLYYTTVVQEPTSGFPLQFGISWDQSKPGWRFFCYCLFASAAANTNAIVPILCTSSN